MKSIAARSRGENGQSLVEFAFVVLVMVVIFMGVFDLGYAVYAYNTVALAAREGARSAIICTTPDDVVRYRVKFYAVGLNLTDPQIPINPPGSPGAASTGPTCKNGSGARPSFQPVTVQVNYTYTPATLLIWNALSGQSVTFSAESTMTVE